MVVWAYTEREWNLISIHQTNFNHKLFIRNLPSVWASNINLVTLKLWNSISNNKLHWSAAPAPPPYTLANAVKPNKIRNDPVYSTIFRYLCNSFDFFPVLTEFVSNFSVLIGYFSLISGTIFFLYDYELMGSIKKLTLKFNEKFNNIFHGFFLPAESIKLQWLKLRL